jgi:hypothetical protein
MGQAPPPNKTLRLTRPERPELFVLDTLAWPLQIADRATLRTRLSVSEVEPTPGFER